MCERLGLGFKEAEASAPIEAHERRPAPTNEENEAHTPVTIRNDSRVHTQQKQSMCSYIRQRKRLTEGAKATDLRQVS
jgi:hypothetical protein